MSSMAVPVALWGPSPPTHHISCIAVTPDQRTIVTGTLDGQIGLWDLRTLQNNTLQLVPKNLIFGHPTPVTALAIANDKWEKASIISSAEEGEICLWDSDDGSCIQYQSQLHGSHTEIQTFQMTSGLKRLWRVIVYGRYSDAFILDAATLELIYKLQSKISPDWLSALCVTKSIQSEGSTIIAVCANRVMKIWNLNDEPQDALFEAEAKTLANGDVHCIRFNQFTNRAMLFVFSDCWQIYDLESYHLLYEMRANDGDCWIGGDFVDVNDVSIWSQSGTAYIFRLPKKCLPDAESVKSISSEEKAVTLHTLLGCSFENVSNKPVLNFSYGSRGSFHKLIVQGNASGEIQIWKLNSFSDAKNYVSDQEITPITSASLSDPWRNPNTKPNGILDNLVQIILSSCDPSVSSTLFIADRGILICGCDNGDIYVTDACVITLMQFLNYGQSNANKPIIHTMKRHNRRVTCLLHPYSDVASYDSKLLVSGSSDFTVNLWNLETGAWLYTFAVHGGGITKLFCCPQSGSSRLANCICGISRDHTVSILSLTERKCLLLAGRHTFPINSIRWRLNEDFLVVSCTDGTIYVWQIETGCLDRCIGGAAAAEILQVHDELTFIGMDATNNMITPLSPTGILPNQIGISATASTPNFHDASLTANESLPNAGNPLRITSVRANLYDSDIQILLFDTEALIIHLLHYDKISSEELEDSQDEEGITFSASSGSAKKPATLLRQSQITYDAAQLELSCLHAWDLDPKLDDICVKRLGLLHPSRPISFGILSKRRSLSLIVPGWEPYCPQLTSSSTGDVNTMSEEDSFVTYSHWMLSSSLTTQHMLAIISVSNTLMEMNHTSFISAFEDDIESNEEAEDREMKEVTRISQIKAGWSQIATLHCVLLPDKLGKHTFKAPLLQVLARRWQHKCLEIREAAQALLLAELNRIGREGRQRTIEVWSPHLPRNFDIGSNAIVSPTDPTSGTPMIDSPSTPQIQTPTGASANTASSRKAISAYEFRRRQITAIVMMGVLGAEFSHELDLRNTRHDKKEQGTTDVAAIAENDVVMYTGKALQFLILQQNSAQFPGNSTVRRTAIDLIGRGFALWQPYLDVASVLLVLLDLSCETASKTSPPNLTSTSLDTSRTAKHALSLIATSKPALLITTLSVQIGRNGPLLISLMQSSPPGSQPPPSATILFQSRGIILHIMEILVEKAPQEVVDLLIEVVNIILHCSDQIQLKSRNLPDSFPSLLKFNMVSFCSKSKRVAVGGQKGQVVIFDTKSVRSYSLSVNSTAVTALAFSADGRMIAVFSLAEARLSFWQIGSSTNIFGMIGNFAPKCVKTCRVNTSRVKDSHVVVQKLVRIVWLSHKELVLLTNGLEQRFSC
ncbi:uncharacterized protein TRIADDRAFT_37484 [Trichoplax adhaerens]|uniref:WD repeat-containing protein 7 n=1 Tax=Trichoplax adhaerens TaxID=10228 RepID=B3RU70_TRIAD|nr:hypothetical protein TRIADDRAFT_37484 [Trichoplax adhaerens]EDV25286.1 hypothetical protein TRIADDRAFT_37484 [Trichoplax adhaerens]|eukprot:XP_002111319.1 hypothetical protein TRIADDRAFT_37484 [Trichoplax adhaerens]